MRDTFKDKLTMVARQTKKQGEREKEKNRNLKIGRDRGENKKQNVLKKEFLL